MMTLYRIATTFIVTDRQTDDCMMYHADSRPYTDRLKSNKRFFHIYLLAIPSRKLRPPKAKKTAIVRSNNRSPCYHAELLATYLLLVSGQLKALVVIGASHPANVSRMLA